MELLFHLLRNLRLAMYSLSPYYKSFYLFRYAKLIKAKKNGQNIGHCIFKYYLCPVIKGRMQSVYGNLIEIQQL